MLTFKVIPNMERFLSLVAHSRGKVMLYLPDNTRCDLKEDRTARQVMQAMAPGRDGIRISLSDPGDVSAFVNFMIGC